MTGEGKRTENEEEETERERREGEGGRKQDSREEGEYST